jgi:RNA polymerase sigma-70 factor (ECF subfamily)
MDTTSPPETAQRTGHALSSHARDADQDDVAAAVRGDRGAFDRLVLRHQQAVVNAAGYFLGDHEDALEVAQESFLRAYRSLGQFRSQATFRTWILRITMNAARSFQARRSAKKRSPSALRSLDGRSGEAGGGNLEIPDERSAPEALALRREVREVLEAAIAELEPQAREALVLRDIAGESYEAISRALRLPVGTVKSRIHRARLQVRERVEGYL